MYSNSFFQSSLQFNKLSIRVVPPHIKFLVSIINVRFDKYIIYKYIIYTYLQMI